jgi:hypothetical protein
MAIRILNKKQTWSLLGEVAAHVVEVKDIVLPDDVGTAAVGMAYEMLWDVDKIAVEEFLSSFDVIDALKIAASRVTEEMPEDISGNPGSLVGQDRG